MNRLVILAPNWLGDAVMALPAIADVRRACPTARIAVAARPAVAPLFGLVPEVNETIVLARPATLRDPQSWGTMGAELADFDFDAAVLLPNSLHAALVASRAGIPERWGYRSSWRGSLLTRAIAKPSGVHQIEYYQWLTDALGFARQATLPSIAVPDAARAGASQLLRAEGWDERTPLVVLAPGAAYGGAKRWPPAYFAELADAFAGDGITCVMVGSAADAPTGNEVRAASRRPARSTHATGTLLNLMGRTELATLAGVMTLARALVTNDSGAMHLGAAAGVSVTAIFGPTDERATRPLGDAHRVLTHPVWCRPCMLRECPLDHSCMRGVAPAAVLDAARRTR
jgi:heptosyltransferase-2